MSQFKVVSKTQFDEFGKNKVIKVDKINPKEHLHISSFKDFNFSFADKGTRGPVEFTKEQLRAIKEQYGPEAVASESVQVEDTEEETPKKKK